MVDPQVTDAVRGGGVAILDGRGLMRLADARATEGVRIFDPVPMRMTRLARRERAQLLIESDQRGPLQAFLADWVAQLYCQRSARELRWQLDVDPLEV